ncbi:MAG: ROK family protein [Sphingobacteriales bacterium]|nr:MAG: ROK family protein [Sphingobacteriales bacterium]
MSKIAIGVDLGGTRIKTVAVDGAGGLLYQEYFATNDGNENWKKTIQRSIDEAKSALGVSNYVVGISAPGIPDERNGVIEFMPGRLNGLENFDWSGYLEKKTWVLNDAVAALMAEATLGSARDRKNVVMLTLGTGVGGAILIDGKPYQGNFQKAGHIGHISLNCEDTADITGMPGSLEDAIGNCTINRRSMGQFKDTHALLEAYRKGDHFAQWVWLTSVRKLAIAIASISNMISPECVILGGGITEAGAELSEPLERFLSLYEWRPGGNKVEVVKAQFNDMAGAIGAACFASVQE